MTVVGLLLAVALTGAAPAFAAGTWQAAGGQTEPSTVDDTAAYLPQTPNQAAVEKIYFNGMQVHGWFYHVDTNPEGASTAGPFVQYAAYLGFWRDCNKDGYIGAKTVSGTYGYSYGQWSNGAYPRDLYGKDVDTTICPTGSAYNTEAFIDEFRWIGPNATPTPERHQREANRPCDPADWLSVLDACTKSYWEDNYDVRDPDALVWLDLSRPEQQAAVTRPVFAADLFDDSSSTLSLVGFYGLHRQVENRTFAVPVDLDNDGKDDSVTPVPTGTWDDKPNFGDCGDGERKFMGGPSLKVYDVVDTNVGTCGLYPLWQAKRLVNDSDSEDEHSTPLVRTFDTEKNDAGAASPCDDTQLPGGFAIADVSPGLNEDPLMEGSIGGSVNNIMKGLGGGGVNRMNGECSKESSPSLLASTTGSPGKNRVDTFLQFQPDDSRFRLLRGQGYDYVPMDGLGVFGGPGAISPGYDSLGVLPESTTSPNGGARWLSYHVYIVAGFGLTSIRPSWHSYYADVSPAAFANNPAADPTTALPAAGQDAHTYGGVECSGNFDDTKENNVGNDYGWICSAAAWDEVRDTFNKRLDRNALRVIVGQKFDLRDVDCNDFSPAKDAQVGDLPITQNPLNGNDVGRESCFQYRHGYVAPSA